MRSGWIPDFGDLTYNLAVQYGWVYGLSLTEMEIVHGAFRKCNPNGNTNFIVLTFPIKEILNATFYLVF